MLENKEKAPICLHVVIATLAAIVTTGSNETAIAPIANAATDLFAIISSFLVFVH